MVPINGIYGTIVHELGHAFGLDHLTADQIYGTYGIVGTSENVITLQSHENRTVNKVQYDDVLGINHLYQ